MARRLTKTLLVVVVTIAAALAAIEIKHRSQYGHFVPLALHADVTVTTVKNGARAVRLYRAHLTNFAILPRRVERCESPVGALGPEFVEYSLQKWDSKESKWEIVAGAPYRCLPSVPRDFRKQASDRL